MFFFTLPEIQEIVPHFEESKASSKSKGRTFTTNPDTRGVTSYVVMAFFYRSGTVRAQ